jgi:enoyl-[acyl-carrier protein] reductase I
MADDWNMPKGDLMKGKRGIVMGVANQNSIAWGISSQLAAQGAEIAFTYQGENLERRVRPLVESIGMDTMISADVTDDASMDAAFAAIKEKWGKIDFLVHSIASGRWDLAPAYHPGSSRVQDVEDGTAPDGAPSSRNSEPASRKRFRRSSR